MTWRRASAYHLEHESGRMRIARVTVVVDREPVQRYELWEAVDESTGTHRLTAPGADGVTLWGLVGRYDSADAAKAAAVTMRAADPAVRNHLKFEAMR